MPSVYEDYCRKLGELAELVVEVAQGCLPLQTFKEKIDRKNRETLISVLDHMSAIGNDGLSMVERCKRPPCAILLGTSSAGKTELLTSFLKHLLEFSGSTAADTTPMLVRLRYPFTPNPPDHGEVTFLMPRDLFKLISDLPRVKDIINQDANLQESWDKVCKLARTPDAKKDAEFERRLYNLLRDFVREMFQWVRVHKDAETAEYFETLADITNHFDPKSDIFTRYNPVDARILKQFLDKGQKPAELANALREKMHLPTGDAAELGKLYYMMRTAGAITQVYVKEDILKAIDIYDTAGVRVGGDEADTLSPAQMVHSQIQAFKNRWGFERLVASVDIIMFILVLEEQQVDTEFQAMFEECRKYGNLKKRLFIFLNKIDKAVDQAVKKGDCKIMESGEVIPDDDKTWKLWVQTNVMDKISGLGEAGFNNVFITRAPKFSFSEKHSRAFLEGSKKSPILHKYLFDVEKNMDACLDDNDGGILFAWKQAEKVMREQGSEIRYNRLAKQLFPLVNDLIYVLASKRVTKEVPTEEQKEEYMLKLMQDLKDLRWKTEEFRKPELFGELVVQKRFATTRQVAEALAKQERIAKEEGRHVQLGQVLMDEGYLSLEQAQELMQAESAAEEENWDLFQRASFKHVRNRIIAQLTSFMEDKGRPIIHGNVPVEGVIEYVTEPIKAMEEEMKGIYTGAERKEFSESVKNIAECQTTLALMNQDRLKQYLFSLKSKITSNFQIRDDISEEEADKVEEFYDKIKAIYDDLPKPHGLGTA